MRIIAGAAGGRRLSAPPEGTRPTTDRVREALFSSLNTYLRDARLDWSQIHVLDLFAGSGAVGLEALSRGAASATLIERDRRCLQVLRANIQAVDPRAVVVPVDAFAWVPEGHRFDLVYLDPPYDVSDGDVKGLLAGLRDQDAFADEALIVVERSRRSGSPWSNTGFQAVRERDYGDTRLWYGRVIPAATMEPAATVEEEA
jgi:16S rRNA (guanine966-N2)-methyltransferase